MGNRSKASIAILLSAAFVAGIFAATFGANWVGAGEMAASPAKATIASLPTASSVVIPPSTSFEESFVQVAESVTRTVVQIRSERMVEQRANNPLEGTPFENSPFGEFFRSPEGNQSIPSAALGSGVIISDKGYIVTNNHVIQGADELEVVLFDGRYFDAEVVGTDAESDLAVVRIKADNLEASSLGKIEDVRLGEWVLAFGSPLSQDLGNTITSGIVSAVGRTSANLSRLNLFASFIQTDAAINPGNSGGPLVDLSGKVIGINSAIYSRSGGSQGIGFAIPVDVVENVVNQLIENGEVERGFLGVTFDGVSTSLADLLAVSRGAAQVTSITPDSPARKAGLEEGDVIVSVNGLALKDSNQLRTIVGNMPPGERITLDVVRDGDHRTVSVVLARRSEFTAVAAAPAEKDTGVEDHMKALGLSVSGVTPALAQRFGVDPSAKGVLVVSVDQSSAAYRDAELRPGDLITEVDRAPVTDEVSFKKLLSGIESGEAFMVKVMRLQADESRAVFTALTKP